MKSFKEKIRQGIPAEIPSVPASAPGVNRAPARPDTLTSKEKKLALKNALRYFPKQWHKTLAPEFAEELNKTGRIYMYRFRPTYEMRARAIDEYPAETPQAAAIMLMIQNNLDNAVAQHPEELITYGGNGTVFQNWAQ
jgi:urocanate hydratase